MPKTPSVKKVSSEKKKTNRIVAVSREYADYARELAERSSKNEKISRDEIIKLSRKWRRVFAGAARAAGIDDESAIATMFDGLAQSCRWPHLSETALESNRSLAEWLSQVASDVSYCSDRWNLDRLFRCHWTHNRTVEKFDDRQHYSYLKESYPVRNMKYEDLMERRSDRKKNARD